jgi:hypothetical protein
MIFLFCAQRLLGRSWGRRFLEIGIFMWKAFFEHWVNVLQGLITKAAA